MGLTCGMTFSLTYNTDFAEAEVDDQQINFTRFFLENAGFFGLGLGSPGAPSLNLFFRGGSGSSPFGTIVPIDCEPV